MSLKSIMAAALRLIPAAELVAERRVRVEPKQIVLEFLEKVRSGRHPDAASQYFASAVQAHQVTAEGETTITRTPADYAAHVRDFIRLFGAFDFDVVECLADGDRVYVRWRQTGHHRASFGGEPPTGHKLTEISSAVYRVEDGRIVEYWIQSDRKGLEVQLQAAGRSSKAESGQNPSADGR